MGICFNFNSGLSSMRNHFRYFMDDRIAYLNPIVRIDSGFYVVFNF